LYQQKNIPPVLAATAILNKRGFVITENHVRSGIKHAAKNTGLLGRWQILSKDPLTIADTAHNEAGIREVVKQIDSTAHRQLHFVLGMVNDKDIRAVLNLLPKSALYYFCKANIPRALAAEELARQAASAGLKGLVFNSVADALKAAKEKAEAEDLIFIGGSTFTAAEVV
jgi:dihydrofolate synthase/folylpolyglutamate synthase